MAAHKARSRGKLCGGITNDREVTNGLANSEAFILLLAQIRCFDRAQGRRDYDFPKVNANRFVVTVQSRDNTLDHIMDHSDLIM